MIQVRQHLALAGEVGAHIVAEQARPQHLERRPLFKVTVTTLDEVNVRHTAPSDASKDLPWAEALRKGLLHQTTRRDQAGCGRFEKAAAVLVSREQEAHFRS